MSLVEFLRSPRAKRFVILAGLWAAIGATLVLFRGVLLLFGVACLLAYVLMPVVRRMTSWQVKGRHLPRWLAVIVVYIVVFGAVYLFALSVVPQVYGEIRRLTDEAREGLNALTPQKLNQWALVVQDWIAARGIPLDVGPTDETQAGHVRLSLDVAQMVRDGLESMSAQVRESFPRMVGVAQALVRRTLGLVFATFFTLMVTGFILVDWENIKSYVFTLLPQDHRNRYDTLVDRIDGSLSGVVRGQLLICAINGVLTLIGLLLLKVKFAFVLSTVAAVLSLIPIFGSIISSVPIVLVGLTQGWHTGLGALAWIVGIHALEAYFLNPRIMGAAAKIHPVLVAFALIAGERTFGFVGALFAVPVTSILINIFAALHSFALELHGVELAAERNAGADRGSSTPAAVAPD